MRKYIFSLLILGFAVITLLPQTTLAQRSRERGRGQGQVYTGNIFYVGGQAGSTSTTFTLNIDNYTSQGELDQYLNALQEGGQDSLMKAISKEKRGTIQFGSQVGRNINAAWVTNGDEGRKITILFERWVGFGELRRGARSLDYPFTFMEIYIDDRGRGDGTLIPAAKVRDKGARTIEVENFGIYPARVTNVRSR